MTTIRVEYDVMVPMRDGVLLATDIYRPDDSTPAPVLLLRTPYNKTRLSIPSSGVMIDVLRAARSGYAVVMQDVRGCFASEGEFTPYIHEGTDGFDTIAWAAAQPWATGVVGTFGGSYLAYDQWLAAREQPVALRAMSPSIGGSEVYEGGAYVGGVKTLVALEWAARRAAEALRRRVARGEAPPGEVNLDPGAMMSHLPLGDHPELLEFATGWDESLAHPTPDPYWLPLAPSSAYELVTVPTLNITGWYDCFLWGTLQNYLGMKRNGGSDSARQNQRLIVGPWSHNDYTTGIFPDRTFGPAANVEAFDLTGRTLRWFDRWLKGEENGLEAEPPVTIFVMGSDEWRSELDWPLPDTRYKDYYLHSGGSANSRLGDGTLSLDDPLDEFSDLFLDDPLRPVPTLGGQSLVLSIGARGHGALDQREAETREDVLVYTTAVLERSVEVIGPVELRLFVSCSAYDADFIGKLVDVHPDGRAIILTEGALRARYHRSLTSPELLEPEEIYELQLNLGATANVFGRGHRIRLDVMGTNFPRFARNSHTGGNLATEGPDEYRPAMNRIFHDSAHPSRLILPSIER